MRSGDSIVVNPKGKEVSISGGISNPAIYELLNTEGLSDLINLAGNLIPGASNLIKVERATDDNSKKYMLCSTLMAVILHLRMEMTSRFQVIPLLVILFTPLN